MPEENDHISRGSDLTEGGWRLSKPADPQLRSTDNSAPTYDESLRGVPARIGICLLNVPLPGLGLIRIGFLKSGLAWASAWVMFALSVLVIYALSRIQHFTHFVALVAVMLVTTLILTIGSTIQSWRNSKFISEEPKQWWSKWHAVVAITAMAIWFSSAFQDYGHRFYKTFYEVAESMAPSLQANEHFFADMRENPNVRRGELVIVRDRSGRDRVYRVVGLSGDRLEITAGVPTINGVKAEQIDQGTFAYRSAFEGAVSSKRLREKLPGEAGAHDILNVDDRAPVDDIAEIIVPARHIFVLGDNRDRAADSRVPFELNGVGFIPMSNILGRPLFIFWSNKRERIGIQLSS